MPTQKSNTKVVTGIVRLSYANVWEPASINGSNPKYSVSLIIPKSDTKTIAAINAAVDAAIKDGVAKFGGKVPPKGALKLCDFTTERFFHLKHGSNRISVSHDGLNTVKMMVEGKISYETV